MDADENTTNPSIVTANLEHSSNYKDLDDFLSLAADLEAPEAVSPCHEHMSLIMSKIII